ncbi:hypothetical protein ARMGADRAFT_605706 [Armillaria gallica]|uniref:Uncharacterized protein n=1 Tax=Armillaria gallica TaxID=47427 RepID=A0A2H3CZE2_ARMGA|nr:hypothetical protein ARMGADRAFT_605706 [Armillaria gallica]
MHCLVDGQRCLLSFHLDRPDSWRGSLVHVGSAVAKVVVRCPEGYHYSEVSLQVIPEVTSTATVFLGMDWLLAYLTATRFVKGSRLSSIDLSGLNDLHSTLSVPMSPLFFWSLSPLKKIIVGFPCYSSNTCLQGCAPVNGVQPVYSFQQIVNSSESGHPFSRSL